MEFLKELLGENYQAFETAINEHNAKPENKDKQIKIANLGTGDYVSKAKYNTLETERDTYKTSLTSAQESLKAFEGVDIKDLQGKLTTLNTELENQKIAYEKQLKDIEYNSHIDSFFGAYKFTSDLAKKAAQDEFKKKEFKLDNGKFLGGEDFMKELQTSNPTAFVAEEDGKPPIIVKGTNQRKPGQKMTLAEAMAYKNAHPEVDITTLI